MSAARGYRTQPLGTNRRLAAASVTVARARNTIHLVTEVDVTEPRRLLAEHKRRTGEQLSFTAYVAACLARVCGELPGFNAFRRGRRLVLLDEVTVSVLVERELAGERIPEPLPIRGADRKGYREIHQELRAAPTRLGSHLGASQGLAWMRFLPDFLLRWSIRLASRSIAVQRRYGVVAVTAVGMFGQGPTWPIPLSAATVSAAVGTVVPRLVLVEGVPEAREHLCVTLSFDHDVVDGAPAARFARRFAELMGSAELLGPDGAGREAQNASSAAMDAQKARATADRSLAGLPTTTQAPPLRS